MEAHSCLPPQPIPRADGPHRQRPACGRLSLSIDAGGGTLTFAGRSSVPVTSLELVARRSGAIAALPLRAAGDDFEAVIAVADVVAVAGADGGLVDVVLADTRGRFRLGRFATTTRPERRLTVDAGEHSVTAEITESGTIALGLDRAPSNRLRVSVASMRQVGDVIECDVDAVSAHDGIAAARLRFVGRLVYRLRGAAVLADVVDAMPPAEGVVMVYVVLTMAEGTERVARVEAPREVVERRARPLVAVRAQVADVLVPFAAVRTHVLAYYREQSGPTITAT